jgi:hypothetical protein
VEISGLSEGKGTEGDEAVALLRRGAVAALAKAWSLVHGAWSVGSRALEWEPLKGAKLMWQWVGLMLWIFEPLIDADLR